MPENFRTCRCRLNDLQGKGFDSQINLYLKIQKYGSNYLLQKSKFINFMLLQFCNYKVLYGSIFFKICIDLCKHGIIQNNPVVYFFVVQVFFYVGDGDNGVDRDGKNLFNFL